MNIQALKNRIRLFDERGLDPNTIRNLKLLIFAVAMGNVCFTITGGVAMTGYLRALGTSDFTYGIIMALSPMFNCLQFIASYWMEKSRARMKIFLTFGIIQRMSYLPFGLIPFIFPNSPQALWVGMAASIMAIISFCAPFMNVCFYSLAADVVPMRIRGRYFATRTRVATIVAVLTGFLISWLLDAIGGMASYALVFTLAAIGGTADIATFFFGKFPELPRQKEMPRMLPMMRDVLRDRNYMKLVLILTVWNFSFQLSAPFYNVYMLGSMAMSYRQITLCMQVVSAICSILTLSLWGNAMDKYGNRPVIYVAGLFVSVMAIAWSFITPGAFILVILMNVINGIFWNPTDLGSQNLFMYNAPEKNRSMYIAIYFIATQLLGIALGNSFGGWLLDNVFIHIEDLGLMLFGAPFTRYQLLFLVSGVLRLGAIVLLLPHISEQGATSPLAIARDSFMWCHRRAAFAGIELKRRKLRRQLRDQDSDRK